MSLAKRDPERHRKTCRPSAYYNSAPLPFGELAIAALALRFLITHAPSIPFLPPATSRPFQTDIGSYPSSWLYKPALVIDLPRTTAPVGVLTAATGLAIRPRPDRRGITLRKRFALTFALDHFRFLNSDFVAKQISHSLCYFKNVNQWVLCCFPLLCPNSGRSGVSSRICDSGISVSHHLKTKVPSGLRTRKHSENPFLSMSRQSFPRVPYFLAIQPDAPFRRKCGGSKTTREKDSDSNGRLVKSATTSGLISKLRDPFLELESFKMCDSLRRSTKTALSSDLLNQNIRDPQQASKTGGLRLIFPN